MRSKRRIRFRSDFDNPWKELLVNHFELSLLFFFPEVHALIDWPKGFEFLDKELRAISRGAKSGRRCADLLVKVRLKSGEFLRVIVHVEAQSRREKKFPERMFVYHYRAYDLGRTPVISLAILADADPDWRPERFGYLHAGRGMDLSFHVCKLVDFRARESELRAHPDPFAKVILAILKTLDTVHNLAERKKWKFEFIKELHRSGLDEQYVDSLLHMLDYFMVLPDTMAKKLELDVQRFEKEERTVRFVSLFERIGLRKGEEIGIRKGQATGTKTARKFLYKVIKSRLGAVPRNMKSAIDKIDDVRKLDKMLDCALKAESIKDIPLK